MDQLGQLGEEIAEETACQGAHHKGADAAQAQQAEEVLHRSLRAVCPQDKDGGQHHQQSVSHIRHHHAVEEDEKRRHEGVGVHIVIGRQGVHLRHHVQRPGQTVVLQLHRHLRILLRRGIRRLPGTAQALQQGAHVCHALRRGPSLEEDNGPVGKQPLRRALPSGLRCQPVRVGPQGVPLPGALRNGRLGLLPPALELLQLPVGLLQIRCRRAGDPRKSSRAEAVGPQDLHYRLLRRPVAEEQQVSLLLVGADLQQLRRQRLQLQPQGAHVRSRGAGPQAGEHVLRSLRLQRQVQILPGQQPCPASLKAGHLGLDPGKGPQPLPHVLGDGFGLRLQSTAQKLLLCDEPALDEQPVLHLSVPPHGGQGGVHLRQGAFGLRQAGALPLQQAGPVLPGGLRLPDLHTAQPLELPQQLFPAGCHGDHPEPLHLYNGHVSLSQPFRQ